MFVNIETHSQVLSVYKSITCPIKSQKHLVYRCLSLRIKLASHSDQKFIKRDLSVSVLIKELHESFHMSFRNIDAKMD